MQPTDSGATTESGGSEAGGDVELTATATYNNNNNNATGNGRHRQGSGNPTTALVKLQQQPPTPLAAAGGEPDLLLPPSTSASALSTANTAANGCQLPFSPGQHQPVLVQPYPGPAQIYHFFPAQQQLLLPGEQQLQQLYLTAGPDQPQQLIASPLIHHQYEGSQRPYGEFPPSAGLHHHPHSLAFPQQQPVYYTPSWYGPHLVPTPYMSAAGDGQGGAVQGPSPTAAQYGMASRPQDQPGQYLDLLRSEGFGKVTKREEEHKKEEEGSCHTCKEIENDKKEQEAEEEKEQQQEAVGRHYQSLGFVPTPTARNMHILSPPHNAALPPSAAYAAAPIVPPNTPAGVDYVAGGGGLLLPPYYAYQPESHHFLFPPGGGGNGSAALPPLTPITPSVEPALGFKNGYIVPQTPNPMTMSQFFQVVQSPAYYPAPVPVYEGVEEPTPPAYSPMPPPGAAAAAESALQLRKPPASRAEKFKQNNEAERMPRERPDVRPQYQYEPQGRFASPFKRFIRFSGIPHLNRFPMPGPASMQEALPRGQWPRNNIYHNHRHQFPRHSHRTGFGSQGGQQNHGAKQKAEGSDAKGSWYKAGARFGQRSQQQQQPPPEEEEEGVQGVTPVTPPATPARQTAAAAPLLSLAEPDLIQGRIKKLVL